MRKNCETKLGLHFIFNYHTGVFYYYQFGFFNDFILNFLPALRKSQKEARLVVQKFSGINDTHTIIHEQGGIDPSDLESSLMHQWKSLFVHMQNILGHESRQLVSFCAIYHLCLIFQISIFTLTLISIPILYKFSRVSILDIAKNWRQLRLMRPQLQ